MERTERWSSKSGFALFSSCKLPQALDADGGGGLLARGRSCGGELGVEVQEQVEDEGWPERGAGSWTAPTGRAASSAEAGHVVEVITEQSGSFRFLSGVRQKGVYQSVCGEKKAGVRVEGEGSCEMLPCGAGW